jgi:hypothetical protein
VGPSRSRKRAGGAGAPGCNVTVAASTATWSSDIAAPPLVRSLMAPDATRGAGTAVSAR